MSDLNCSSEVSNDYYGLGVRLGIYMIWVTSWLANNWVPDEISGALDANSIFLLALLTSIFRGTFSHGANQLRYIDGLILMHLCAGYLFGCFSLWGYRTVWYLQEGRKGIRHFGRVGTHFRLILMAAISAYGIWFWIEGVEDGLAELRYGPKPGEEEGAVKYACYPLVTFFFTKLRVKGGIRIWYIFITISCTIYFGLMLLIATVERLMLAWGAKRFFSVGKYETGLTSKELRYASLFCRWGNLAWLIWSIITVELTLIWNKVVDVTGGSNIAIPGQLLPLLIGAAGLVRILYIIHRDHRPFRSKLEAASRNLANPEAGLGLQMEKEADASSCCPSQEDAELDDVVVRGRSNTLRYLVACYPWLSVSELWLRPNREQKASLNNASVPNQRNSIQPLMATTPITPGTEPLPQSQSQEIESPNEPKEASMRIYDLVTNKGASSSVREE